MKILRGLMVGSQGTLGFIAETVFDTVPLDRMTCTALLFFPDLPAAAAAVPFFNQAGARAVELMDGNTLRACAAVDGVPDDWQDIPQENAALLVEFRAATQEDHLAHRQAAANVLKGLRLVTPVASVTNTFVTDPGVAHTYWHAREAFMTAVGKARPSGTTLITEDFAVPPSRLAEAGEALLEMQRRHGYDAAVAGHAAHGNLHFLLAFDASRPEDVERYAAFMDEFCAMVVDRFDGSLKAEHATGRNMTPFLEAEWGPAATELMWRVKQAFDPHGVIAPGVVLNRDATAHLKHLKTIPVIEAVADPCIECGFCEPVCPSRDLTTTPRQRIVLRREMLRQPAGSPVTDSLLASYGYDAVDTCAGDSTCKIACPVGIDTGAMMKGFRHQRHGERAERNAERVAEHFAAVEKTVRVALGVAEHVDDRLLNRATTLARKAVAPDLVPEWISAIPGPASARLPRTRREGAAAVYFVACVYRIFAGPRGGEDLSLPEAVVTLSERAGRPVWVPSDIAGSCCATIWHSKGYDDGNTYMANQTVERAWKWTDGGRLPLVVDASSCTLGIGHEITPYLTPENKRRHERLDVVDSLVWAARELLPHLTAVADLRPGPDVLPGGAVVRAGVHGHVLLVGVVQVRGLESELRRLRSGQVVLRADKPAVLIRADLGPLSLSTTAKEPSPPWNCRVPSRRGGINGSALALPIRPPQNKGHIPAHTGRQSAPIRSSSGSRSYSFEFGASSGSQPRSAARRAIWKRVLAPSALPASLTCFCTVRRLMLRTRAIASSFIPVAMRSRIAWVRSSIRVVCRVRRGAGQSCRLSSDTGTACFQMASNSAASAATRAGEWTTSDPAEGRSSCRGRRAAVRSNRTSLTGSRELRRNSPPLALPRSAVSSDTVSVKPSVS
ncbi:hypothetical protein GCM10023080_073790 [Streptomyces pseudoechinosporeus]